MCSVTCQKTGWAKVSRVVVLEPVRLSPGVVPGLARSQVEEKGVGELYFYKYKEGCSLELISTATGVLNRKNTLHQMLAEATALVLISSDEEIYRYIGQLSTWWFLWVPVKVRSLRLTAQYALAAHVLICRLEQERRYF